MVLARVLGYSKLTEVICLAVHNFAGLELFRYWQLSFNPRVVFFAVILRSIIFFIVITFFVITGYMPADFFHGFITNGTIHSYILTLSSSIRFG